MIIRQWKALHGSRSMRAGTRLRTTSASVLTRPRISALELLARGVEGRIALRQDVGRPLARLPHRDGRLAALARHEARRRHALHLVDVARAVREDLADR